MEGCHYEPQLEGALRKPQLPSDGRLSLRKTSFALVEGKKKALITTVRGMSLLSPRLPQREACHPPGCWGRWRRAQRPRWTEQPEYPTRTWSGRTLPAFCGARRSARLHSQCLLPGPSPVAPQSLLACSCGNTHET